MIGGGGEGMLRDFEKRAKSIEELRGRLQDFTAQQEELVKGHQRAQISLGTRAR